MSNPLNPNPAPPKTTMQPDATTCNHSRPPAPDQQASQPQPNQELTSPTTSSPDPLVVAPIQLQAIELILQGHSTRHIAKTLSIHRTTLYRWKHFHAGFISQLGQRRKDLHETARQRLSSLLTRSLKVVSKDLSSEDHAHRLAAARLIISHCAPRSTAPDPDEATHPSDVIDPLAEHFRKELVGDAADHIPLTPLDRQQALTYLSENLAAPHLVGDPSDLQESGG